MSRDIIFLPDELIKRMKSVMPTRERNQIIAELLKKEIDAREEVQCQQILLLESDSNLQTEMKVLDKELFNDGLRNVLAL